MTRRKNENIRGPPWRDQALPATLTIPKMSGLNSARGIPVALSTSTARYGEIRPSSQRSTVDLSTWGVSNLPNSSSDILPFFSRYRLIADFLRGSRTNLETPHLAKAVRPSTMSWQTWSKEVIRRPRHSPLRQVHTRKLRTGLIASAPNQTEACCPPTELLSAGRPQTLQPSAFATILGRSGTS